MRCVKRKRYDRMIFPTSRVSNTFNEKQSNKYYYYYYEHTISYAGRHGRRNV